MASTAMLSLTLVASVLSAPPTSVVVIGGSSGMGKALATAVIGAEYVLGWLPRGTHDWSKFVTPDEADAGLTAAGLVTEPAIGVSYNPLADSWKLSGDTKVNYMIVARRPAE